MPATASAFSAVSVEAGARRLRPLDKERHRGNMLQVSERRQPVWIRDGQRRHSDLALGPNVQRLPGRGQYAEVRAGCQQSGDVRRDLQHLLAVVEYQQETALPQMPEDGFPRRLVSGFAHTECGGNSRHDEGRIGNWSQIDKEDAVRVVIHHLDSDRLCQVGLPRPARTGEGDEANVILR